MVTRYMRPAEQAAPDILRLNPAMTPFQMGTNIATQGVGAQAGAHRGDAAQEFFKNVVARRLLTPEGTVQPGEYADLIRPIEEQYMRDVLGLSFEPGNIGSVLSALGVAPTGGQIQRQAGPGAPGAPRRESGDRFGQDLGRRDAGATIDLGFDPTGGGAGGPEMGEPTDVAENVGATISRAVPLNPLEEALEDVSFSDVGSTLGGLAPIPGGGILGSLIGTAIDKATAPGEGTTNMGMVRDVDDALAAELGIPLPPSATGARGAEDRRGASPEAAAAANIGADIATDMAGAALGVGSSSKSSKSKSSSRSSKSRSSRDGGDRGGRGEGSDAASSSGDPSGGYSGPFNEGGMVYAPPSPTDLVRAAMMNQAGYANGGWVGHQGNVGAYVNTSGVEDHGYQTGGTIVDGVPAPPEAAPDNVAITAQTGEVVMNRPAVNALGPDFLNTLNSVFLNNPTVEPKVALKTATAMLPTRNDDGLAYPATMNPVPANGGMNALANTVSQGMNDITKDASFVSGGPIGVAPIPN